GPSRGSLASESLLHYFHLSRAIADRLVLRAFEPARHAAPLVLPLDEPSLDVAHGRCLRGDCLLLPVRCLGRDLEPVRTTRLTPAGAVHGNVSPALCPHSHSRSHACARIDLH